MNFIKRLLKLIGTAFLVLLATVAVLLFSDQEETSDSYSATGDFGNQYQSESFDTEDTDAKSATVLMYLIGSDLESDGGCASADIGEICSANLPDNLNFVIQTGGAKKWSNSKISAAKLQRFEVKNQDITLVDEQKRVLMSDPSSLSDFLKWGVKNYPADRYAVILWNHGGGSIIGYGSDEYSADDALDLKELSKAFSKVDAHFDFIGFDACLMGTIETAYALSPYADYLIASEETEPGTGWYYTEWLNNWSENVAMSTPLIGKNIVHSYVNGPNSSWWDDTTLSVIRLDKISGVYETLCDYLAGARQTLSNQGFSQIASARSDVKSYGNSGYDQIDIASFVQRADLDSSGSELLDAIRQAVVYYDGSIADSTGLAMYYPYKYPNVYSTAREQFKSIGMNNASYERFFDDFLSIMVYGQRSSGEKTKSAIAQLTDYEDTTQTPDYTNEAWYDSDTATADADSAAQLNLTTGEDLKLTESGGNHVLHLTEEQWASIAQIDLNVLVDDGEGYLDLGLDSVGSYDENGDLIVDFDYQWLTINDQFVPFYSMGVTYQDDDNWFSSGYIPAVLNGDKDIEIVLCWDNEHEDGIIAGYRDAAPDSSNMTLPSKNLLSFTQGDKLDFYFDYYTYDGAYSNSYAIEQESLTVGADGLRLNYEDIAEDETTVISYRLCDLYQNEYWTEPLVLE